MRSPSPFENRLSSQVQPPIMDRSRGGQAMRGLGYSIAAAMAASLAGSAHAAGPADVRINGSRVHPESITSDAAGNIYTGSTGGTIYRATPGAATAGGDAL